MEPLTGIEPANLLFTRQLLYQLSYRGMAPSAGLEPATGGVETRYSIQLSYEGKELVVDTFLRSDTAVISVLMVTHDRNGV